MHEVSSTKATTQLTMKPLARLRHSADDVTVEFPAEVEIGGRLRELGYVVSLALDNS